MKVASERELRLANRVTYGWTPSLSRQIKRAGGLVAWFEQQLDPASIPDPAASDVKNWSPWLAKSADHWAPGVRADNFLTAQERMEAFETTVLVQRILSKRQVLEVMTEFWEHSLNVPAIAAETHGLFRFDYHETVKSHALGRYEDLLFAAITHPAMGLYLSNAGSTSAAPVENLARELLELHTVGVGRYSEADVKNSARILTGWRVRGYSATGSSPAHFDLSYDPASHWTGPVRVLDFTDPNSDPDGRDLTRRYLAYLAHHPATAQRVARRLCVQFVSDNPPTELVDRLAATYLKHQTAIKPVLRQLVRSSDFFNAPRRMRTPTDDVAATLRVLGFSPLGVRGRRNAEYASWLPLTVGSTILGWPRPDGSPLERSSWMSPTRVLGSFSMHYEVAAGWTAEGMGWFEPWTSWIPRDEMRFNDLVDHLSRRILGRPSTPRLLMACCIAANVEPRAVVRWKRPGIVQDRLQPVLGTILDSPAHMTN